MDGKRVYFHINAMKKILFILMTLGLVGLQSPSQAAKRCPMERIAVTLDGVIVSSDIWYSTSSSSLTDLPSGTSGTSGCASNVEKLQQLTYFIKNYPYIAEDASKGQGKYLNGLASLMGCSQEGFSNFSVLLQKKYAVIFQEIPQKASWKYLEQFEGCKTGL